MPQTVYRLKDFAGTSSADGLIIGSGPTRTDYADLSPWPGMVALVNNSLAMSRLFDRPILATLHPDIFVDQINARNVLPLFPKHYLPDQLLTDFIIFNWLERHVAEPPNVETNTFRCAANSTLLAVHLMSVAGVKRIIFVGCGKIDGEWRKNHDPRLGGVDNPDPRQCYRMIRRSCNILGIEAEFR